MQKSVTSHGSHTGNIETLLGLVPDEGESPSNASEMESNWAKYICILVYGYMEWAIRETLVQHVRSNASPNVARHVWNTHGPDRGNRCQAQILRIASLCPRSALAYLQDMSRASLRYASRCIKIWNLFNGSPRNMKSEVIVEILRRFDEQWGHSMKKWFAEDAIRKQQINEIVSWRNDISHGNAKNTGNVTIQSVRGKFELVQELVQKVQETVRA